jgi:DNA-binding Lrp family transcriptional regulator
MHEDKYAFDAMWCNSISILVAADGGSMLLLRNIRFGRLVMITAFILINAQRERIADAADEILSLPGVTEVYSVAGDYDLVAVARVRENEELAKLVTDDMIAVKGLTKTATLIAFRQYSKHDLERMFGLD